MAKNIKILKTDHKIRWPEKCAVCGTEVTELGGVETSIHQTITQAEKHRNKLLHTQYSVRYPICTKHSGRARFCTWMTCQSPLSLAVRWVSYIVGMPIYITSILPLLLLIFQLYVVDRAYAKTGNLIGFMDIGSWPVFIFNHLAAVLFLVVVWCFRRVPVRLVKLNGDKVSIRFFNARYAQDFVQANESIVIAEK